MAKSKRKGWFSSPIFRRDLSIIGFVAIIIAIPLTVVMSQRQQETRQQAAGTECVYAFNTSSICRSYCTGQTGKTCIQNLNRRWGCCGRNVSPTPAPTVGTPLNWCSRCSDTYKYCNVSWQSTQNCTDTWNAKYNLNCSCTQGTIDCGVKGINTSACKPTSPPISKPPPVSIAPTVSRITCARCSDTYKYCFATWTENKGSTCSRSAASNPSNPYYQLDCSCKGGTQVNSACPWARCSGPTP